MSDKNNTFEYQMAHSPLKESVLNWYDFKCDASVLLIGERSCGLKELFLRRGCEVTVLGESDDISQYDYVFIGFPIWYGAAPNVVNSFCRRYDWTGISVNVFATSGGSGIGKTADKLRPYVQGASEVNAELFKNPADMLVWAQAIGI